MGTQLNVLIVEDSADDAALVCEHLVGAGYAAASRVVDTEAEYLSALESQPELILCDHNLPQFNSQRALELMQARGLDIPFILVSGTLGEDQAVEALQRGATDYLLKDRLSRLGVAVERALERKRLREERRTAERETRRLATIVNSALDAIISRSMDGTILSWNPGAEQLFGYTAEEAIGQHISTVFPPDRKKEAASNRMLLTQGHPVAPYETVCLAKDGRRIDVLLSQSPMRDAEGRVIGAAIIFRDISDRKRADNALRESEQRFRAIFDHAGVGITMRSARERDRPWLQVNDYFCKLLGYTREEILKLSTGAITPSDEQPCALDDNRRLLAGEVQSYVREKRVVRKDGQSLWVNLAVAALPDANGLPSDLIAVYQDITERKRLEGEAQRKARITEMLEALARSANEAGNPEDAMRACLTLLTEFGGWALARLGIYRSTPKFRNPDRSVWYAREPGSYEPFIHGGTENGHFRSDGRLISSVLREKKPCWIPDLAAMPQRPGRVADALAQGFRCAFAFPVTVNGEIAAFLEFFGMSVRELDADLVAVSSTIAAQLARLIERERAQSANAQLAAIVRAADDGVMSCSPDGTITSWNAGAERLFGYTAQEAVGQPATMLFREAERAGFQDILTSAAIAYDARHYEGVRVAKDGRFVDVAVTAFPIRGENERLLSVGVIYHDITERVRLEREAHQKAHLSELLQALARAANEAETPEQAMRACLDGICEHGNWRIGHVVVFRPDTTPYCKAASLWRIGDVDRKRFASFIEDSESYDFTKANGPLIGTMLAKKRPVWIEDIRDKPFKGRCKGLQGHQLHSAFGLPVVVRGEVLALLEFFGDGVRPPDTALLENSTHVAAQLARVIERRRAFDKLEASQKKLEGILGSLREVVYSCDYETYTPTYLNTAAEWMTGYRKCDFEADPMLWFKIIHRGDQSQVQIALDRLKKDGTSSAEYRIVRRNGDIRFVQNSAQVVRDGDGKPLRIDGVVVDITERRLAEERADHLARFDALTDLPNRALFQDRLSLAMAHARRRDEVLGVMVVNLDRFKKINDSLGIGAGDSVLHDIAKRFQSALRDVDTIARLGGNEFAVLVEGVKRAEDVLAVGRKLIDALALPFRTGGNEIFISASVGIAVYPNGTSEPQGLIQNAEVAMRRVKSEGGNDCQLHDERRAPQRIRQLELEVQLRHALEKHELEVHFQPKVNLLTGAVSGAEALVRWNNPELGAVSPAQFIPLAEETGLIIPIGDWVLRTACAQLSEWRTAGYDVDMAVNLSPRQFRQKDLANTVASALAETRLDAKHLILEITEGTAMSRPDQAVAVLNTLHQLGVKLAVDDFGTGYSSLGYLKRFPLHSVKVDRSFVDDLGKDAHSEALVPAIVALAHSLKLRVVAEGVETEQQRDFLGGAGCDEAQGFLYGRAVPAQDFLALLKQSGNRGPVKSVPA